MLDQKVGLQGVGMIVIDLFSLLEGDPVVAPVIVVMIDHSHLVAEGFLDPSGKSGLAAAGTARNADDKHKVELFVFRAAKVLLFFDIHKTLVAKNAFFYSISRAR